MQAVEGLQGKRVFLRSQLLQFQLQQIDLAFEVPRGAVANNAHRIESF